MTVFDRQDDQKLKPAIYPAAYGAAHTGDAIVDTAGFKAAVIYIVAGTIADSAWVFDVEASDHSDMSSSVVASTANGDLIEHNITMDGTQSMSAPGTVATITTVSQTFVQSTDGNSQRRFGYVGPNRYLRVDVGTVTGTPGTGGVFAAFVVLSEPDVKPAVQS